ncbi:MAG: glycosyltransferase, partial [Nevskiales bacterium]
GNSVTLARLAAGLRAAGARVRLLAPGERGPRAHFDVVHAFHATKAGPRALHLARRSRAPLVVTLTGTDLHQDLPNSQKGKAVRRILQQAAALLVFNTADRARLRRSAKTQAAKAREIPAAVGPHFFACGPGHGG